MNKTDNIDNENNIENADKFDKTADAEKGLLVVSFGTSYPETRAKTIDAIEAELETGFPERRFYHAFSSGFIVRKLRQSGEMIPTVEEALEQAAADGITDLLIQPTHLMFAQEYVKLARLFQDWRERFVSLRLGDPLLADDRDLEEIAAKLPEMYPMVDWTSNDQISNDQTPDARASALVLMGHGTDHAYNEIYHRLNRVLARHYDNVFVGTVEASPGLDDVCSFLKELEQRAGRENDVDGVVAADGAVTADEKGSGDREDAVIGKNDAASQPLHVYLVPLLVVAGDHAINDMASDKPDSWKSVLTAQGYQVHCILQGLGEFPEIREMYVRHAEEAENSVMTVVIVD